MAVPGGPPGAEALLQHGDFVRALARSLVRDPHRAEDVAQEAMLAAIESPPHERTNVKGWLARVTRNLAAFTGRSETRRRAREQVYAAGLRVVEDDPTTAVLERLEWERRVVESVRALDEPYRSTVVYRYFEQLEPAAIAKRMGVPRKTVYTRLERALERLRARFDEETEGGRAAWCAALLPLATLPLTTGVAAGAVAGATAAGVSKLVLAAGVVAVGGAFATGVLWGERAPEREDGVAPVRAIPPRAREAEAPPPEASVTPGPPPAARSLDDRIVGFRARIDAAADTFWVVHPIGIDIASLPPDEALAVMSALLPEVEPVGKARQLLKAFSPGFGMLPACAPDVYDVAVRDPRPELRAAAFYHLRDYAYADFADDPDGYRAWRERWAGRPLDEMLPACASSFAERLRGADPATRDALLVQMGDPDLTGPEALDALELPRRLREAGLLELLGDWTRTWALAGAAEDSAHAWIRELRPPEAWLRAHYGAALRGGESPHFERAVEAFGRRGHGWAVAPLTEAFAATRTGKQVDAVAEGLQRIGGPAAIAALIGALQDDAQGALARRFGEGALERLTAVPYDESHDAAWWRAWWDDNRAAMDPAQAPARLPVVRVGAPGR